MNLFNEPQDQSVFHLGIDDTARAYMLETARWTKFLAIIGFIFTGVLLVAAIVGGLTKARSSTFEYSYFVGTIFGYVLFSMLYIYPAAALLQFSKSIKLALLQSDMMRFNMAMKYQRNMFKYLGILIIVIIGIYGIVILGVAMSGGFHS